MNSETSATTQVDTTPLAAVQTEIGNWRERSLRPMLVAALILTPLAVIPATLSNQGLVFSLVFLAAYVGLAILMLLPSGYVVRLTGLLLIIYVLGLAELLSTGILGNAIFFFLGLVLIATMMMSPRAGAFATLLAFATMGIVAWQIQTGHLVLMNRLAMPAKPTDWLSVGTTTFLFCAVIVLGFRQFERELGRAQVRVTEALNRLSSERSSLEKRVEARTVQLRAINAVGTQASAILDPDELISRIVNIITDLLGHYYAAVFLLDEKGTQAYLQSATGEAGRLLKESGHHLPVDGKSMVGSALTTGEAQVALDVEARPDRFRNPLLPYTMSEIALPLKVGGRVLGVLDVQSTKRAAFGPGDIETLQGMATQIAIAYENARLFQASRRNVEELEAAQRQYVREAWATMPASPDLEYTVGDEDLPPESQALEVPLTLRDEIIGQISLAGADEWTPDQRSFIESVATQAALALENARLVQATQTTAMHEHLLAEITAKVWGANSIEGILQAAVSELGLALGASEATIELGMENSRE